MPAQGSKLLDFAHRDNKEQDEWHAEPVKADVIKQRAREQFENILAFVDNAKGLSFHEVEVRVVDFAFVIGRLLLTLFLARRHEQLFLPPFQYVGEVCYKRGEASGRDFGTFFGKIYYWRTRMTGNGGYYPLDHAVALPPDGFSLMVLSLTSRLATKMSYEQAWLVFGCFQGWSPSTDAIERAVLGLGKRTATWIEQAPAPEGDGETLVVEIDNKATPTATDEELARRRGKRQPQAFPDSPRHRGRAKRQQRGPKKRRKKGDKSKNGRATTVLTMFTLKAAITPDGKPYLRGPINKRVYASYAKKEHVFAIARRDADKRGFTVESGKCVQFVSDGDEALAELAKKYFPNARHTLDWVHATEYLWKAGRCFLKEGSARLKTWAGEQKTRLLNGQVHRVLRELRERLAAIPKTGPGNKGRRKRAATSLNYLRKRVHMMSYKELRRLDLEIASGAVEGAVRYVVAQRFDQCGMRWIRERAEALLQLRCVEINGQWDDFVAFVLSTGTGTAGTPLKGVPFLSARPAPLPTFGLKAAS
jgi:hypothetical protein